MKDCVSHKTILSKASNVKGVSTNIGIPLGTLEIGQESKTQQPKIAGLLKLFSRSSFDSLLRIKLMLWHMCAEKPLSGGHIFVQGVNRMLSPMG